PDDPGAAAMRSEAESKNFFPPEVGLIISNWGELLDLTNPDAYAWWQDHVRTYVDQGIEGFKLDYAEDVVVGIAGARAPWRFFDGSTERTMHKRYQLLYHRLYAETLPEDGGFLLCRAGTYGDQTNVSVIWPGDLDANMAAHGELVDDDGEPYTAVGGLPAAVAASLSLGPSGFPFFASDTGGYRHAPPDKETFVRWFQFTALTPIMQVGTGSSDVPWQFTPQNGFDDESLAWYRTYARLHLRLFPYVWTYAQRLATTGRPLQRPLGLAYPELDVHPADTYLLGGNLLVAPVVARGANSRKLTLPPGAWVDWWTGEVLHGPADTTVAAPLGTLPLFLRVGGIVPLLRPTIDTLAPTTEPALVDSFATDPGRLYARIAPGPVRSRFDLYDGTGLRQRLGKTALYLDITPGEVFTQGVQLEVLALPPVAAVKDGDTDLPPRKDLAALEQADEGWVYEAGALHVRVGPGPHNLVATLAE
ncbi:MAG TPA: TIM-barrel domain-containing protein, partial [Nannocystis sp.]